MGTIPQPPEGGDPHGQLGRDMAEGFEWSMQMHQETDARVTAIEEVIAARWPRRWLLAVRLRRQLAASVASYGDWAGEAWADKRSQAVGDAMIDRQPPPPPSHPATAVASRPPVATGVAADGSAVVAAADLPTLLGALADAATCQGGHLSTPHVAAAYRALARALGDDR